MLQAPIHSGLKAEVLDDAPMMIAIQDTDHNILWANKAYLKATGLSLQEIEGEKCYSAWQLDKPCRGCPVRLSIEDGEPHQTELTPQNQDHWNISNGSWMSWSTPIRDAEGRIIGSAERFYDITELKRSEEALRESEERYRHATTQLEAILTTFPRLFFSRTQRIIFCE